MSSALIVVIMGFLMYTMDQTQRTMRGADSRVNQFQTARVAFEAMTRNLSQATLNTFWELDFSVKEDMNKVKKAEPAGYRRNSDLHFVSGKASELIHKKPTSIINPTHGVFFQAPLGVTYQEDNTIMTSTGYTDVKDANPDIVESKRKYRFLNGLLNVCGYYIHWGPDPRIPTFLKDDAITKDANKRYRYRLTEVIQPSETVTIYNAPWYTNPGMKSLGGTTSDNARGTIYENSTDWIRVAVGKLDPTLGPKTDYSRPLADNIVAMIIVPKLSVSDRDQPTSLDDLSTNYEYDSRPQKVYDAAAKGDFEGGVAQINGLLSDKDPDRELTQYAQLPPILQVTLVAIDDESAARIEQSLSVPENGPEEHWADGVFEKLSDEKQFNHDLGDPLNADAASLLGRLSGRDTSLKLPKVNFRIFTTDVVMRSSKWSNPNKK